MLNPVFYLDAEGIKDKDGNPHTLFDMSAVDGSGAIRREAVRDHPAKNKYILRIKQYADDAMVIAKELDGHDASSTMVEELLDMARKFDTERFERDYLTFQNFR